MSERVQIDPFHAREIAKAKTEEEKRRFIEMTEAYRKLFDSDLGRIVFRDLMEFCQTFESTMTGNSWTYYNEGKRAVGLHILYMREYGVGKELNLMQQETYKKSKEVKE